MSEEQGRDWQQAPQVLSPFKVKIVIGTAPGATIEVEQPVPIDPVMLEGAMKVLALALGAKIPDGKAATPARPQVTGSFNPRQDPRDRAQYEAALRGEKE